MDWVVWLIVGVLFGVLAVLECRLPRPVVPIPKPAKNGSIQLLKIDFAGMVADLNAFVADFNTQNRSRAGIQATLHGLGSLLAFWSAWLSFCSPPGA